MEEKMKEKEKEKRKKKKKKMEKAIHERHRPLQKYSLARS